MGRAGVGVSLTALKTRVIRDRGELVTHFDQSAADYREAHGDADRLLAYRLGLIRRNYKALKDGVLLEIGCGTGIHLANLAGDFARVIGTDISPKMISAAREKLQGWPGSERIELRVDPAEELSTVEDTSIDVALCVGAFEHMLEKDRVLRQVQRVLKRGGVFVCLTPNGEYWWYTGLAPFLGIATRHLSTDRFLTRRETATLLRDAGLAVHNLAHWTFVPKGDMPRWISSILSASDWLGRVWQIGRLRGGLTVCATKRG